MTARVGLCAASAGSVLALLAGPPVLRTVGVPGVLAYLLPCLVTVALASAAMVRVPSGPCRTLGQDAVAVLALGTLSCWLLGTLVYRLLGSNGVQPAAASGLPPWFAVSVALLIAPVVEEAVFRGALQRTALYMAPRVPQAALVLSASVFALAHQRPAYLLAVAGLGLLCGLAATIGRSLLPAVLVHVGFNAAAMLVPTRHIDTLASGPAAVPALVLSAAGSCAAVVWLWRRAFAP